MDNKNEIRTESYNEKTPFTRWNIDRKSSVSFTEDPTFRQGSKDISIKDFTNNNAIDCNIYEVIEKYRGDLKMTAEQMNKFHIEVAEELSEIKSLPDAIKQIHKAEESWRNLPLDVRKEFGNSVQNFMKNGKSYLEGKIKSYNDEIARLEALRQQEALKQEILNKQNGGVING